MSGPIESASALPSVSVMASLAQLIDQYGVVALLVVCLTIATTLLRGKNKDVAVWVCFTIVGLCSLTIIADATKKLLNSGEIGGGTINQVPSNMFLYSNEANNFFVARLRNSTFLDRNDYKWIRLNNGSQEQFRQVDFIIDQNRLKHNRDTTQPALKVVGDDIDPAPIRFTLVVPVEELDALRNRTLSLDLHTPTGTLPYILDRGRKVAGNIVDPNDATTTGDGGGEKGPIKAGSLLITSAYAGQTIVNPEDALKSTRADTRAQGLRALEEQFNSKLHWINKVLEDPNSSSDLRLAVVYTIRNHFKNATDIEYPHPAQFQFLTPASYTRMILDGLDTTTALGVNNRFLLNNVRDERVDQSFDLVSQRIFAESDAAHKSCLALFHLSVQYNWAFLIADQQLKSGQPFTHFVLANILGILGHARQNMPLLVGDDVVQGARLDFIEGVIFGRVSTASTAAVAPEINRGEMRERSKKAFEKFLHDVPNGQRDNYRYPAHFGVAKAFLANPSPAALEPTSNYVKPEHGCSDPGEAS